MFPPRPRARNFTENDYSPDVNKREGLDMNLSAPTNLVFVVSIVLAILAVIGTFTPLPFISEHAFWVAIAGYVILALGNILRNF